jgi:KaiC/GvpD/RAD55 family RecA-like ATPase
MEALLYNDIFEELLIEIHKALAHCHRLYKQGKPLLESDETLLSFFTKFHRKYSSSGLNAHITKGLTATEQDRYNIFPRLSKLVIYNYIQAQEAKKSGNYIAEIIPSPLSILYHALTVPEEPQTSSYAFVLCRSRLFYFLNIHPRHSDLKEISPDFDDFREEDILKSISSYKNHININARWPDQRANFKSYTTRINYLTGHILSLKGLTFLWFNNDEQLLNFCGIKKSQENVTHLKKLYANDFSQKEKYCFRLSSAFLELPDSSEIMNWIFGLPVPLRGGDLLFYGGLKKTHNGGLVISLHGQPGAGKTSTALSLAAVFSPYDTKTVYISLEEDPEDLVTRLNTLIPEYLKWLSIYEDNIANHKRKHDKEYQLSWFTPYKFNDNLNLSDVTNILNKLKGQINGQANSTNHDNKSVSIPSVCPLLIVIDNVNELFSDEAKDKAKYREIEDFISQCRNMGAIVLLIAADDIPGKFKLDYLVDVAIHLKLNGINNQYEKPVRIFQLIKTRHQISRQGSHVFHLSNSKGFRISPQVPSQMDKREKIKIQLPSKINFIHSLNLLSDKRVYQYQKFLPIASNSQILIHGYGSSGKAGFGLKLLFTPLMDEHIHRENIITDEKIKDYRKIILKKNQINKVLVVSFLYPVEYYEVLHERLLKQFEFGFKNFDRRKSILNVKAFYPGFLTPEDFVYKIVRLLEEAKLEGEPYTGILLDGLHNVFLQFKNLQEAHMIWPLLYSILYRYSLTVVSTFTNFSLNEKHDAENTHSIQTPDDFMLMQQGQKPFLHGLVKAADYYFLLEEIINNSNRKYLLSIRSSIRQIPPTNSLNWDREKLTLINENI